MYINPASLKHLRFHATSEKPVFNLTVSRESAEWLLSLIPTTDTAHDQIRKELERVAEQYTNEQLP